MQIPPEKIHEILERTDLVALVSRHVELKKSGRAYKGLCPFHGEKTPSFHVTPERRIFKCFGCDAGGDAIAFQMRISGRPFVEVVRELAKEAGVTLEEREDPASRERAQLLEANEQARRLFEDQLWKDPRAAPGREHLAKRSVSEELARHFGLGYAVNAWNEVVNRFVREGILEWGARAGLCAPRTKSDGFYDVFRGRLMIPIRSPEGRTVAFGARLIEENPRPDGNSGPKYLNSKDSPLYRKSEVLYGLDLAKDEIRRSRTAVLVEGYFDVIGLHGAGVKNAVALCSTALTAGHLQALSRADAQDLVLLLDGDAAGLKAVERLAGPILASGAKARVACLPQGDDPDTFALREGKAALDSLVEKAPVLSRHLLHQCLPSPRTSSLEEKLAALARLTPVLEQMPAGVAKSMFLTELADHLGVPESDIKAHLNREVKAAPRPKPAPQAKPVSASLSPHEELLAALLIADPPLRDEPEARFADQIRSLEVRLLLIAERPLEALNSLAPALRQGLERRLSEIAQTMAEPDKRRKALRDSCAGMRLSQVMEQVAEKKAELIEAERSGAPEDELSRLQAEFGQLMTQRKRFEDRSRVAADAEGVAAAARGRAQ